MTSIHHYTLALALIVITLATAAFQCSSTPDQRALQTRVIRAVAVVPSIVRIVKPDLDPRVLAAIDAGIGTFSDFQANPTADKWRLASDSWERHVKPALLNLKSTRTSLIVAAVDVVMSQIVIAPGEVTAGDQSGSPGVTVQLTRDAVKDLEDAVKLDVDKP